MSTRLSAARALWIAAGLGMLVATTQPAFATTIAPLTVEQVTDAADLVVRGTVEQVWTDLDEHGHVFTYADVRVTRVVKGEADVDDYVTVETPGGVLPDGRIALAPSAARYDEGEDVFLFLAEKRFGTAWGTVGMTLGKYTVRQNPDDGSDMVVRFTRPWDEKYDHRFIPHPPKDQRVSVDSMETRVRARVEAGWDGKPIPGVSPDHLRQINKLQPGVK
jgi:hypothetical protein